MIPSPIPSDATPGERRVAEALAALPDDLAVCYRRLFPGRRHMEEPDFVVIGREIGLIVLEVKDWKRGRPPEGLRAENPLEQAKRYVHGLQDVVRERGFPVLVEPEGRYQKELVFPCVPAVVFPYLTRDRWEEVGAHVDTRHVLFQEDLAPALLLNRLRGLARLYFPPRLTAAQVEFLQGLVAPEFCLEPIADGPPRQLDPVQMQAVTTDLFLPPSEQRLVRDLSARLVRGVPGSGKTLVLLMRARLLQRLQPSWRILVLTYTKDLAHFLTATFARLGGDPATLEITHFHKWCRSLLVEVGEWQDPLADRDRLPLVAEAIRKVEAASGARAEAVADEIAWVKEYVEPPFDEKYPRMRRIGRGMGPCERGTILTVLRRYEELLGKTKCWDWQDIPLHVRDLIEAGRIASPRYHALLIDETQDFAPSWFRVLVRMLRPETNLLFLTGDGAQRVFRRDLCWQKMGIPLRGRSRVLRRVYRNTYEISTFAADWIQRHRVAEDLTQYGETWADAEWDHAWVRHGSEPTLTGFSDHQAERAFVAGEIRKLLGAGRSPADILVLYARRDAASATAEALAREQIPAVAVKESGLTLDPPSVNVCTYHSAKGLEFPIVFCSMAHLFRDSRTFASEDAAKQAEAEAARLLYVGMTRARDALHVTYLSS